jgi:hypothetical protein
MNDRENLSSTQGLHPSSEEYLRHDPGSTP